MLAHELFDGIDRIQAPRPEVLVVPGVFADGDGQPYAVQLHHLLLLGALKVALFVEDVVEGQEALVLLEQQQAVIEQDGGVHRWLAAFTARLERDSREHGGGQLPGGRGQLIDGRSAASEKAGLFKEVGGRIAADGKL